MTVTGNAVNQLKFLRHTAYQEAKIDTEGWKGFIGTIFFFIRLKLINPSMKVNSVIYVFLRPNVFNLNKLANQTTYSLIDRK